MKFTIEVFAEQKDLLSLELRQYKDEDENEVFDNGDDYDNYLQDKCR